LGSLEDPGTSQSPGGFADPSTPDSSDGQQQQIQQQQQQQQAIPAQRDPCESRQLAIYDTILTVSQAHHAHCAYTEEKIRNLVRTPVILVSFSPSFDLHNFLKIQFIYLGRRTDGGFFG